MVPKIARKNILNECHTNYSKFFPDSWPAVGSRGVEHLAHHTKVKSSSTHLANGTKKWPEKIF
jgi:hypothetical protein